MYGYQHQAIKQHQRFPGGGIGVCLVFGALSALPIRADVAPPPVINIAPTPAIKTPSLSAQKRPAWMLRRADPTSSTDAAHGAVARTLKGDQIYFLAPADFDPQQPQKCKVDDGCMLSGNSAIEAKSGTLTVFEFAEASSSEYFLQWRGVGKKSPITFRNVMHYTWNNDKTKLLLVQWNAKPSKGELVYQYTTSIFDTQSEKTTVVPSNTCLGRHSFFWKNGWIVSESEEDVGGHFICIHDGDGKLLGRYENFAPIQMAASEMVPMNPLGVVSEQKNTFYFVGTSDDFGTDFAQCGLQIVSLDDPNNTSKTAALYQFPNPTAKDGMPFGCASIEFKFSTSASGLAVKYVEIVEEGQPKPQWKTPTRIAP